MNNNSVWIIVNENHDIMSPDHLFVKQSKEEAIHSFITCEYYTRLGFYECNHCETNELFINVPDLWKHINEIHGIQCVEYIQKI